MFTWDKGKGLLALVPAFIFWFVSAYMFIFGLSIDDTTGIWFWIAVGLSISNTIIQIIGNDREAEDLGWILYIGWICSYIMGIGTNVYSLSIMLNIQNPYIEWPVVLALGAMIEIMPEKLFIYFKDTLRVVGLKRRGGSNNDHRNEPQRPNNPQQPNTSQRPVVPSGMTRAEYDAKMRERQGF